MPLMFSAVVISHDDKIREFIVPGIPATKEDLEQDASFVEYEKQFESKTHLTAKVQTYIYEKNEEGLRDYPDLISRVKRDFRFPGEHCKPATVSELKIWVG